MAFPDPRRVISLIASSTEIVCALGAGDRLVGRSHECDWPEWVTRLPVLTEAKLATNGTSYEIDQRVKAIVAEGLSVYRVDPKILGRLRPDLILTQTQCEVCAVSLKDVEAAVCELVDSHPRIVSLESNSLDDIWRDILKVAEALSMIEEGKRLVDECEGRMHRISRTARGRLERPRVALLEWIDPLMACGNWMPELVELAGGTNLFGEAGRHSPWMTWEELVRADPDLIVIVPCGFKIPRTLEEARTLTQRADWPRLKAVREGRVAIADGNAYFNRPGPRIVESLEILVEILHPGLPRRHEGSGWVPLA